MSEAYKSFIKDLPHYEITRYSSLYPKQLFDLGSKSPALHIIGSLDVLATPLISIIGARKATPYGLACAKMAGTISAQCGLTVVSGGAIGCDSEAAQAALDAGGKTIVIPGCGADILYPSSSNSLFIKAIESGGCILSIERWSAEPTRYTFLKRNDIIAALSRSLIVCEAGIKSGTFSTATKAAELGRHVYAVPGSIYSQTSWGTNHLIESGAAPICDEDALELLISMDFECLRFQREKKKSESDKLLCALKANPMTVTEIADYLKLDTPSAFSLIADYEAAGLIERMLSGRYSPCVQTLLNR